MDVLLIVDMQESVLLGDKKHNLSSVIEAINRLATRVREHAGRVIFVQHDGLPGDDFAPFTPGWEILGSMQRDPRDRSVRKTHNDAFFGTSLKAELVALGARRLIVCGWATDLCVDATVRSAAALGFEVLVASDCHTVSARPHLSAQAVMEHHHWVWSNVICEHPVMVVREAEIRSGG